MRARPIPFILLVLTAALTATAPLAGPAQAAPTTTAASASCATPTQPGLMTCFSLRRSGGAATAGTPAGYGPADLRAAYKLPGTGGTGATVAIVDAPAEVHFNHPGVAITVSTGDNGTGAAYPATSKYVTAVGGTSLSRAGTTTRGWTEKAWSGAGSGCSALEAKPTWQTVSTGCARRAEADVSAVADPNTGVAVYNGGWAGYRRSTAAAPIVAAVYALAGTPGATDYPAAYPYAHQTSLFDVTTGSNGTCGVGMCTARTGWDGPTGLGTPNGLAAFSKGGTTTPAPNPTPTPTPTAPKCTAAQLVANG